MTDTFTDYIEVGDTVYVTTNEKYANFYAGRLLSVTPHGIVIDDTYARDVKGTTFIGWNAISVAKLAKRGER